MVAALRCVRPQFQWYQLAYATEIKSLQLHDSIEGHSQKIISFTLHYIFHKMFIFGLVFNSVPSHFHFPLRIDIDCMTLMYIVLNGFSTQVCNIHVTIMFPDQSCLRVGWTRGSGRVGSGHDFVGFCRVGSGQHFGFFSFLLIISWYLNRCESSNTTFGLIDFLRYLK